MNIIEIANEIFKLLKIAPLVGYFLIILFSVLIFLGSIYIKNLFERKFHKNKLIRDSKYLERDKNKEEIFKILFEIENRIIRKIDNNQVVFNPEKEDVHKILEKTQKVLYENTSNLSDSLKKSLSNIELTLECFNPKSLLKGTEEDKNKFYKESKVVNDIFESCSRDLKMYSKQIKEELEKIKY